MQAHKTPLKLPKYTQNPKSRTSEASLTYDQGSYAHALRYMGIAHFKNVKTQTIVTKTVACEKKPDNLPLLFKFIPRCYDVYCKLAKCINQRNKHPVKSWA